jgi:tetratricopeptide (TPR) repeat protein
VGVDAQKKKSFIKRAWVNTISRYNYYFNAKEMVAEAKRNAALAHRDDFSEVVYIFPYSDQANLSGNLPQMEEAIKKCNHIITRRQSSKWVDDSWFMIGKANFFKGDFFAAIEAFEYVSASYKNKPIRYEAELWNVKSLLKLEKYDEAVALSELMLADRNFPKKLTKELYLVNAEALIYKRKYNQGYERLNKVLSKVKRSEYRYRRQFVAGQLAYLNKKPELAIKHFKKVTKSNPAYDFDFYARINMVRMYAKPPVNNPKKSKNILAKMLKDDKNLDFKDQIYYELALVELQMGDKEAAMRDFKNALSFGNNPNLKSDIYLTLAELYFETTNYEQAQKYYDSAVQVLDPTNPEFENINQRHQVLTDLITNLKDIYYQDSMLRLARDADYRKRTLIAIKEEERKRKEEEEWRKNNPYDNTQFVDGMPGMPGMPGGMPGGANQVAGGKFPFYDPQLKLKGQNDFRMAWGNDRNLGDFWRILAIAETAKEEESVKEENKEDEEETVIVKKELPKDIAEDDAKYFENVPFEKEEQKEAELSMGRSYFQAANIYREKLDETEKSKKLLEEFLKRFKEGQNPYRENALYLLIKIYQAENNSSKVQELKNLLQKEFPESDFIQILDNPDFVNDSRKQKTPETIVKEFYYQFYNSFQSKNFDSMQLIYKQVKKEYPGNALDGNFDFIYALMLIEKGQTKEYVAIMQDLAVNFGGTPLGSLADERLRAYNRLMNTGAEGGEGTETPIKKASPYKKGNPETEHHFIMQIERNMDLNLIRIAFSDFNRDFRADMGLQITSSFIGTGTRVLIITGFQNQKDVKKYIADALLNEGLKKAIKSETNNKSLIFINIENFSILMKEKVWEDYLNYFIKSYL